MNIADVAIDPSQFDGKDRLDIIFEKQDELRAAYGIPVANLDVPADQAIVREFAWNTVEELSEALEVMTGSKDPQHLRDEVADALSFYVELMLICGIKASDLKCSHTGPGDELERWFTLDDGNVKYKASLRREHSTFVEKLALAINNLKNRKWRKTNVQTNVFTFQKDMYMTFLHFIRVIKSFELTSDDVFDAYVRKVEVNKFRLRSNY